MADATRSAPSAADLEFARLFERLSEQILAGEQIDLDLLTQDYPQYSRKLAELLPTLRAMVSMGAPAPLRGELPVEVGRERILGDFRILREVGRGGMGVVYEAEQISLSRRVALKILPFAAVLDERQLARFKNEALAAALLEYPHIVPVYAVGCERGIHFYAMRFIEGQTLAEAFRRGDSVGSAVRTNEPSDALDSLSPGNHVVQDDAPAVADRAEDLGDSARVDRSAQRTPQAETRRVADLSTQLVPASPAWWRRLADLGIQAAEALDHAHQHGIVHRDVKPGNLLLDAQGQLWVTDFGLAQVSGSAELTMTGDMLGTLRYMSPEQARGERILDQRTDVYSLGVTLYELIVGRPAFPGTDRQQLLRQIVEEEPTPPRQLNKRVPVDLETIVMKAMEKEPETRYRSAHALAHDLRCFLEKQPILAKAPTARDRLSKWARRHPGLIRVSVLALLVVATTTSISALLLSAAYRREIDLHHRAKLLQADAVQERERSRHSQYLAEVRHAPHEWDSGQVGRLYRTLLGHVPKAGERDLRGWEWYYLLSLCHQDVRTFAGQRGSVSSVAWDPRGERLASAGSDGFVRVWSRVNGRCQQFPTTALPPIDCVRWRPDGSQLLTLGSEGVARWWDSSTFALLHTLRLDPLTTPYRLAAEWTRDGDKIAFVVPGQAVVLCDARDPHAAARRLQNTGSLGMLDMAWSPDGRELATSIWGAGVGIWRTTDFADLGFTERPSRSLLEVRAIDWSSDGALFAAGGDGAEACVWNAATRRLVQSLPHNAPVDAIAFQSAGRLLATGTRSQRIEVWNAETGEHVATLRGHTGPVTSIAWSPDGALLASSSEDGSVKLWEPEPQSDRLVFSKTEAIGPLAWQPGDRLLACGWSDGTVKLLDSEDLSVKAVVEAAPDPRDLSQPTWSADGRYLAWRHGTWGAVWDCQDLEGPAIRIERADMAAWHPTQCTAAFAVGDEVQLWDASARELLRTVRDEQIVYSLAWNRDGRFLATTGELGFVTIWSTQDWSRVSSFPVAKRGKYGGVLAWDHQSDKLAVGCQDGRVSVWDTAAGVELAALTGHAAAITKLAWTPDGKRIASSSSDQTARLWDARTGDEISLLSASDAFHVALSTDGTRIAAAGKGGLGQIWDARAGYDQGAPKNH